MKNINNILVSIAMVFLQANVAQALTMDESLSNAGAFKIRGEIGIRGSGGGKTYQATKLGPQDTDKVKQLVSGLGYVMQSEASISNDGTIFALASQGQGSQTELFLIIFVSGKSVVLPVSSVTKTTVTFKGGTLEIVNPKGS